MTRSFFARNPSTLIFIASLAIFTVIVTVASDAYGFGFLSTSFVKTLGKTLCLCLVALAMDLIWGYAGILSLGHMAFFALGGYMIGMWLMYARTEEIVVAAMSQGGLPATQEQISQGIATQIFGVVGSSDLPAIWSFAQSLPLQQTMALAVPGLLALVFSSLAFRSRVTGVYLSILTQAMILALALYLFQNDSRLRGNNGLSDLQNLPGLGQTSQDLVSIWFFWASALALGLGYLTLAAIAGVLYYPQAGIINPAELAPNCVDLSRRLGRDRRTRQALWCDHRRGLRFASIQRLHLGPPAGHPAWPRIAELGGLVAGDPWPCLRRRHYFRTQRHRPAFRPLPAHCDAGPQGRPLGPDDGSLQEQEAQP